MREARTERVLRGLRAKASEALRCGNRELFGAWADMHDMVRSAAFGPLA